MENGISLAIPLAGFAVQSEGSIYFHLIVRDTTLSVLPLKVRRRMVAQIAPGAQP